MTGWEPRIVALETGAGVQLVRTSGSADTTEVVATLTTEEALRLAAALIGAVLAASTKRP